jgi:exodeoxyribonuclease V gamma subunit
MEELASALADVVRRPLASAMTEEVIVVSSQGLERWLSQELAVRLGVCANARFPFPRTFIDELIGKGASEEDGPTFDRESLSFAIAALLPEIAERQGAESIAAYLSSDPRGQKRFELARQIAGVFDQYAVYRPDLVAAWERGSGHGWQPDLWRALPFTCASCRGSRRNARFTSFFSRRARWRSPGTRSPRRSARSAATSRRS